MLIISKRDAFERLDYTGICERVAVQVDAVVNSGDIKLNLPWLAADIQLLWLNNIAILYSDSRWNVDRLSFVPGTCAWLCPSYLQQSEAWDTGYDTLDVRHQIDSVQ